MLSPVVSHEIGWSSMFLAVVPMRIGLLPRSINQEKFYPMNQVLKIAVIGLGQQATQNHLPAIVQSRAFQLVAVADIDPAKASMVAEHYGVAGFSRVEELLDRVSIDVALLALPHHLYLGTMGDLAARGIPIIKEKPFATSLQEARQMQSLIETYHIFIGVTMQRRLNPVFQAFHQLKRRIGKIYSVEGRYVMNIPDLEQGWRASKEEAGGGALVDMGYHYIDLLVWYLGIPQHVTAHLTRGNRPKQIYDVEDTAHLAFDYQCGTSPEEKMVGSFIISRVYPHKEERLLAYGTEGIIEVERGRIRHLNSQGEEIERLERRGGWPSAAIDQLEFFAQQIRDYQPGQETCLHEHLAHVAIIEAAYESDRLGQACDPSKYLAQLQPAQGGVK